VAADSLVHNSDTFAAAQQLARGRPLISERWLADSIASSKLLDVKQYQLQAATPAAQGGAHAGANPDAQVIKQQAGFHQTSSPCIVVHATIAVALHASSASQLIQTAGHATGHWTCT
jgi:hypothetical protein